MDFARVCLLVFALFNTVYVLRAATQTAASGLGKNCNANVTCVTNAVCSKTNTCVCSPAFKVNGPKCSPKVIDATCSAANANKICSLPNSECDSSSNKCACKAGYNNRNDQCLKALGSACGSVNASSVCTTLNAVCNNTRKLCACKAGFVAEDAACPKAVGQNCTSATECVSNADCVKSSNKCTCKGGFKNADGLCAPSSAVEHRLAFSIFGASLLLAILNLF